MPAFAIAGTTVPVELDSFIVEYDPVMAVGRRFSGAMSSATRDSANIQARRWSFTSGILTDTEADSLENTLQAPGYVTISGDLIGGSVSCEARAIERSDGWQADQNRVSAELLEVLS